MSVIARNLNIANIILHNKIKFDFVSIKLEKYELYRSGPDNAAWICPVDIKSNQFLLTDLNHIILYSSTFYSWFHFITNVKEKLNIESLDLII